MGQTERERFVALVGAGRTRLAPTPFQRGVLWGGLLADGANVVAGVPAQARIHLVDGFRVFVVRAVSGDGPV